MRRGIGDGGSGGDRVDRGRGAINGVRCGPAAWDSASWRCCDSPLREDLQSNGRPISIGYCIGVGDIVRYQITGIQLREPQLQD